MSNEIILAHIYKPINKIKPTKVYEEGREIFAYAYGNKTKILEHKVGNGVTQYKNLMNLMDLHPFKDSEDFGYNNKTIVAGGNNSGDTARRLQQIPYLDTLSVDNNGQFFVYADYYDKSIKRWSIGSSQSNYIFGGPQANQTNPLEIVNYAEGVCHDPSTGKVWYTSYYTHAVYEIDLYGAPGQDAVLIFGGNGKGFATNQLSDPGAILYDKPNNTFYVFNGGSRTIVKFVKGETTCTLVAGVVNQSTTALNHITYVYGMQIFNGVLYYLDYNKHRLMKWPTGATEGTLVFGQLNQPGTALNQMYYPEGFVIDSVGNIIITDSNNNRILLLESGKTTAKILLDNLSYPTGICIDTNNKIYFYDDNLNTILRYDRINGEIRTIANPAKGLSIDGKRILTEADEKDLTIYVKKDDIYNALDSENIAIPLSAKQGKTLNDSKINKTDSYNGTDYIGIDKVLDARVGKTLEDSKINKTDSYNGTDYTGTDKVLDARVAKTLVDSIALKPDVPGLNFIITHQTDSISWQSMVFGQGKFSAHSANSNKTVISYNGKDWILKDTNISVAIAEVRFINGKYYGAGGSTIDHTKPIIYVSDDGWNWTGLLYKPNGSTFVLRAINYGGGKFVAIGSDSLASYATPNIVFYSTDGITWNQGVLPAQGTYARLSYGNGVWVAVGNNFGTNTTQRAAYSADGITWNLATLPSNNWYGLVFAQGRFIAVGYANTDRIAHSTDGITWIVSVIPYHNSNAWSGIYYENGLYIIIGARDFYLTSVDGTTWVQRSYPQTAVIMNFAAFGNGMWALTGFSNTAGLSRIFTSGTFVKDVTVEDLLTSTNTTNALSANQGKLLNEAKINKTDSYNGTDYTGTDKVLDARVGKILNDSLQLKTTISGHDWILRNTPADLNWWNLAYGNGRFVAIAATAGSTSAMVSTDGNNWILGTTPAGRSWSGICFGNGIFVATSGAGTGNRIMTSVDGLVWVSRVTPEDNSWNAVTYGNGKFVAVSTTGISNRVMTSVDGITWVIGVTSADGNYWIDVKFGNGIFVAISYGSSTAGITNQIMTSTDGVTWVERVAPSISAWGALAFGNGLFVAVSSTITDTNQVMTSTDGVTWILRTSAITNEWQKVSFGNNLFVAVSRTGTGNRIMISSDGINWILKTSPADYLWYGIAFGKGMWVGVSISGTGNRAMSSGIAVEQLVIEDNLTSTSTDKALSAKQGKVLNEKINASNILDLCLACSDEVTDLIAGPNKLTIMIPYAITITSVFASLSVAPSGSSFVIDMNQAGVSFLSTKLSIDASEKSSNTAAIPYVLTNAIIPAYTEITIDIDQIGSVTPGKGLKVFIIANKN